MEQIKEMEQVSGGRVIKTEDGKFVHALGPEFDTEEEAKEFKGKMKGHFNKHGEHHHHKHGDKGCHKGICDPQPPELPKPPTISPML